MPWCGLEKLGVGVSASWSSTRKRFGPAKSSACAKEEAYRVSGDLKGANCSSRRCGWARQKILCRM